MASTYLERAASGSVTSDKILTISTWLKKGVNGERQRWFNHENASSHTQKLDLHFETGDQFRMGWWDGSNEYNLDTTRKFRDLNAWYHFVFRLDTTQSTASDRVRLYVNGELQTLTAIGGGSPTYPAQNGTMNLGQKKLVYGRYQAASPSSYWKGSMSHSHYCDGYSYAPTEFGETDSTTGEWKIKTNVSVNYGTNGHFILKDGNSVTDQSGNSNNFTVAGGTFTNTEDNPSNVFATINPLNVPTSNAPTFANGNTTSTTPGSSGRFGGTSTLGMSAGKYYWEAKYVISGLPRGEFGVTYDPSEQARNNATASNYADAWCYQSEGGSIRNNNSNLDTEATYANGDIVMCALDLTNNKIYFGKNGTWVNSGDPTSGSTGTGAYSVTADKTYFTITSDNTSGSDQQTYQFNFGNGYFGTTAISSEGTNASGIGKFEYDVPTGYTALSTKGLNE